MTPAPPVTPAAVSTARHAVALSVGNSHACAVLREGTLQCWGSGSHGELGNGEPTPSSVTAVTVAGITNATAVAAGDFDSCAVLADGEVRCWGSNFNRGLGDTPSTLVSVPIRIPGIAAATAIVNRAWHFCALLSNGTVQCWGINGVGQLGNGTHVALPSDRPVSEPVTVLGISTATALAAGSYHTCALLRGGTVKCWGSNLVGQLGNPSVRSSDTPVAVEGITGAVAIAAGLEYSCAVLTDSTIRCWGAPPFGARRLPEGAIPKPVPGINGATALAGGDAHLCALLRDGTVRCWGNNRRGQLGDGSTTDREVPVTVQGLSNVTAISAGPDNTCALLGDGSLRCWGQNVYGTLGDGTTRDSSVPVAVLDLTVRPAHCQGGWPPLRAAPLPEAVVRQWFETQGVAPGEPLPTCYQKLTWPGEPSATLLCTQPYFTSFGGQDFADQRVEVLGVRRGTLGYWFFMYIAAGTATDASCGPYRAIDQLLVQLDLTVDTTGQVFLLSDRSGVSCDDTLARLTGDWQRGAISTEAYSNWSSKVDEVCRARGVYPWGDSRFSPAR